jgi:hypothetical protein
MDNRLTDLRNVACGLILGVALTLAMGQAPAERHASPRYQITAFAGLRGPEAIILDHETNKVYWKPMKDITDDGVTVDNMLKKEFSN